MQEWSPKADFTHHAHTAAITTVTASERFVVTGSKDETIQLYDMKKRVEHGALLHHDGMCWVKGSFPWCTGSPDWERSHWVSVMAILFVLDVFLKGVSMIYLKPAVVCTGTITCLEFYGSSHLLSGGEDGLLCVWNSKKWQCLKSIKAHKYADRDAADKRKLLCQLSFFLGCGSTKPSCPLFFLRGSVTSLSVHPSGKLALTVGADQTLRWNSDVWQIELRSSTIDTDCWAFSTFRTWNLINGRSAFIKNIKQSEPDHNTKVSEPTCETSQTFLPICLSLDAHIVRWSPDGDSYAVVIHDKVDIYELETASVTVTITNPKRISSLQFLNVGSLNLDVCLLYRYHRHEDNDM